MLIAATTPLSLVDRLRRASEDGLEANIRRWFHFAGHRDGDWIEFQALSVPDGRYRSNQYAHVQSDDDAVKVLARAEGWNATGLYLVLNEIHPAVPTRSKPAQWHIAQKGESTTDSEIVARRFLYLDADFQRPKNTSATWEQLLCALAVTERAFDRLASILGSDASLAVGMSGNGGAVLAALRDVPATHEASQIIKGVVHAAAHVFGADGVKIDRSVVELKRLAPAWGTTKRKGAPGNKERPHRATGLIVPEIVQPIGTRELERILESLLADLTPEQRTEVDRAMGRKAATTAGASPKSAAAEDVFARANDRDVREVLVHCGLLDGDDVTCPGCGLVGTRGDTSVAIVGNGVKCSHDRCAGKGRNGFRTVVDIVAEHLSIPPIEAVRQLGEWFSFHVEAPSQPRKDRSARQVAIQGSSGPKRNQSDSGSGASTVQMRPRTANQDPPAIQITTDERTVNDAALAALALRCPQLYRRGFALVHVVRDDEQGARIDRPGGAVRIGEVPPGRLREMLSEVARWTKWDKKEKDTVDAHPPDFTVKALTARGEWPALRRLVAVAETPVLRADGTILDTPGYDALTGLLYMPSASFPPVPKQPTLKEAVRAIAELADVVADFPFAAPAHRATWIAALLSVFARHAFTGPTPLFLIDANIRGAGKSLLADVIALIFTGRPMPRMAPTDDDAEMRKRITTSAMAADSLVLIDNVVGTLGTPSLDGALTATIWKDRILGTNDQHEWPLFAVWFATGNNLVLVGDTSRRCVHIRLESPEEQPERREGFRHPELMSWVRAERPRLVVAALTVLRAYWAAGRPVTRPLPAWGSFEGWSALVRGALAWAGEADPGETREELQSTADTDAAALADLVRGWQEIVLDNGGRCTAAQALADLTADTTQKRFEALRCALAELCPTKPGTLPSAKSVGKMLARFRGRVVGGKAIMMVKERGEHGREWAVQNVQRFGGQPCGS